MWEGLYFSTNSGFDTNTRPIVRDESYIILTNGIYFHPSSGRVTPKCCITVRKPPNTCLKSWKYSPVRHFGPINENSPPAYSEHHVTAFPQNSCQSHRLPPFFYKRSAFRCKCIVIFSNTACVLRFIVYSALIFEKPRSPALNINRKCFNWKKKKKEGYYQMWEEKR